METRGEREKETEIQIAKEEEKRNKEKKNVRRTGGEDQLPSCLILFFRTVFSLLSPFVFYFSACVWSVQRKRIKQCRSTCHHHFSMMGGNRIERIFLFFSCLTYSPHWLRDWHHQHAWGTLHWNRRKWIEKKWKIKNKLPVKMEWYQWQVSLGGQTSPYWRIPKKRERKFMTS